MRLLIDTQLIERKLGYCFNDKSLLVTAFIHSGYDHMKKLNCNNERLEHLGDAVIGLVVTSYLYNKFTNKREGSLSKMRDAIVSGDGLAKATEKLGIFEFLQTADKQTVEASAKLPSSLFEAVAGAIYLDGGIAKATDFVVANLREYLDRADILVANPKSRLQEWCQQKEKSFEYIYLGKTGPDNKPLHTCKLVVDDKTIGVASATSKQKAEKQLAQKALQVLKL